eukprot:3937802-Rhodomonas_salina.1
MPAAGLRSAGKAACTAVIADAGRAEVHCLTEGVCTEWTTVAHNRPGGLILEWDHRVIIGLMAEPIITVQKRLFPDMPPQLNH